MNKCIVNWFGRVVSCQDENKWHRWMDKHAGKHSSKEVQPFPGCTIRYVFTGRTEKPYEVTVTDGRLLRRGFSVMNYDTREGADRALNAALRMERVAYHTHLARSRADVLPGFASGAQVTAQQATTALIDLAMASSAATAARQSREMREVDLVSSRPLYGEVNLSELPHAIISAGVPVTDLVGDISNIEDTPVVYRGLNARVEVRRMKDNRPKPTVQGCIGPRKRMIDLGEDT